MKAYIHTYIFGPTYPNSIGSWEHESFIMKLLHEKLLAISGVCVEKLFRLFGTELSSSVTIFHDESKKLKCNSSNTIMMHCILLFENIF